MKILILVVLMSCLPSVRAEAPGEAASKPVTREISAPGVTAPSPLRDGQQQITIFADRTYFTVFAGDGLTYMPFPVIPKPDDLGAGVSVKGGAVEVRQLGAFALKSIWEHQSTPKN